MNFFSELHRSITDPVFYKEVLASPKRYIAGFLLKLLLFTTILTGASQTYYLLDSERGIPGRLEAAFPNTQIKDGVLQSENTEPYVPPSYLILPVLDQLFGVPHVFDTDSDSILIVDTDQSHNYSLKVPVILMKSDRLVFLLNAKTSFAVPYRDLLLGQKDLKFTASDIRAFLFGNLFSIFMYCVFSSLVQSLFLLTFSVLFLAVAAYFFRVEKGRSIVHYIKAACFAVSPISVGSVIIGLSGVKLSWTWHILIFISTIVMFRAMVASGTKTKKTEEVL